MKTEFTQAEVVKLPFAHHVLREGIQTDEKVPIDIEGNHWHITDVYLTDVVGSLDSRYAGKTWLDFLVWMPLMVLTIVLSACEIFKEHLITISLKKGSGIIVLRTLMVSFISMMGIIER